MRAGPGWGGEGMGGGGGGLLHLTNALFRHNDKTCSQTLGTMGML